MIRSVCFVGDGPLASACLRGLTDQGIEPVMGLSGADLLVSVHYGAKVPLDILERFRLAVNLHTGLLPLNKGVHTCAAPILRGDTQSGVTMHEMTDRIDCGDVILQASYPVLAIDTCASLYRKAVKVGIGLFADFLRLLRGPQPIKTLLGLRRPQAGKGYRTFSWQIDFTEEIQPDDPMAEQKQRAYFFPPKQFPRVIRGGKRFLLVGLFPEVLQPI